MPSKRENLWSLLMNVDIRSDHDGSQEGMHRYLAGRHIPAASSRAIWVAHAFGLEVPEKEETTACDQTKVWSCRLEKWRLEFEGLLQPSRWAPMDFWEGAPASQWKMSGGHLFEKEHGKFKKHHAGIPGPSDRAVLQGAWLCGIWGGALGRPHFELQSIACGPFLHCQAQK